MTSSPAVPPSSRDPVTGLEGGAYLAHAISLFGEMRKRAEAALTQVEEEDLGRRLDPESNSLAMLIKHVAGNMLSRWTDFLTTDGEKPSRRRDSEFESSTADTRAALEERWNAGWATFLATLRSLTPTDLSREVRIREKPLTVFAAIERQKEHYAYHLGQLAFLAKHWAGPRWRTLSIARGVSEAWRKGSA